MVVPLNIIYIYILLYVFLILLLVYMLYYCKKNFTENFEINSNDIETFIKKLKEDFNIVPNVSILPNNTSIINDLNNITLPNQSTLYKLNFDTTGERLKETIVRAYYNKLILSNRLLKESTISFYNEHLKTNQEHFKTSCYDTLHQTIKILRDTKIKFNKVHELKRHIDNNTVYNTECKILYDELFSKLPKVMPDNPLRIITETFKNYLDGLTYNDLPYKEQYTIFIENVRRKLLITPLFDNDNIFRLMVCNHMGMLEYFKEKLNEFLLQILDDENDTFIYNMANINANMRPCSLYFSKNGDNCGNYPVLYDLSYLQLSILNNMNGNEIYYNNKMYPKTIIENIMLEKVSNSNLGACKINFGNLLEVDNIDDGDTYPNKVYGIQTKNDEKLWGTCFYSLKQEENNEVGINQIISNISTQTKLVNDDKTVIENINCKSGCQSNNSNMFLPFNVKMDDNYDGIIQRANTIIDIPHNSIFMKIQFIIEKDKYKFAINFVKFNINSKQFEAYTDRGVLNEKIKKNFFTFKIDTDNTFLSPNKKNVDVNVCKFYKNVVYETSKVPIEFSLEDFGIDKINLKDIIRNLDFHSLVIKGSSLINLKSQEYNTMVSKSQEYDTMVSSINNQINIINKARRTKYDDENAVLQQKKNNISRDLMILKNNMETVKNRRETNNTKLTALRNELSKYKTIRDQALAPISKKISEIDKLIYNIQINIKNSKEWWKVIYHNNQIRDRDAQQNKKNAMVFQKNLVESQYSVLLKSIENSINSLSAEFGDNNSGPYSKLYYELERNIINTSKTFYDTNQSLMNLWNKGITNLNHLDSYLINHNFYNYIVKGVVDVNVKANDNYLKKLYNGKFITSNDNSIYIKII